MGSGYPLFPMGGGAILPPPCLKTTEMVEKGWGLACDTKVTTTFRKAESVVYDVILAVTSAHLLEDVVFMISAYDVSYVWRFLHLPLTKMP